MSRNTLSSLWNSSSVSAMERTAREQADGLCAKKIADRWLDIWWDDACDSFLYKYHGKVVTREEAVKLHPGGSGK